MKCFNKSNSFFFLLDLTSLHHLQRLHQAEQNDLTQEAFLVAYILGVSLSHPGHHPSNK